MKTTEEPIRLERNRLIHGCMTEGHEVLAGAKGTVSVHEGAAPTADDDPWRGLERHEIQLDQKLLVVKGSKGVIGCPYLDVGMFEELGEACAIIPAVDTTGMLDSKVTAVTPKARELGIEVGMPGRDALDKIRQELVPVIRTGHSRRAGRAASKSARPHAAYAAREVPACLPAIQPVPKRSKQVRAQTATGQRPLRLGDQVDPEALDGAIDGDIGRERRIPLVRLEDRRQYAPTS